MSLSGKIETVRIQARHFFYRYAQEKRWKEGKSFAHVTYYAISNVGDTVLSNCVRTVFEKRRLCVKWKLVKLDDPVNSRILRRINRQQAVVIGGGGLFLPDTNKNQKSGWQWAASKEQIASITAPVIIFSVGFNYFRNGHSVSALFCENLNVLIEKAAFVGLRNHGSIMAVRALVKPELRDKIVFQPCVTTLIRKLYRMPDKVPSNKIAVNMAFDREEMRYGDRQELILTQTARGIALLRKRGYEIVYILHCESDRRFLPYLDRQKVPYTVEDACNWMPQKLTEFYNSVELVIGMRGHSQMIPFGVNCEIISLGTHDKMRWFLEDIEAEDWYIEMSENPEQLSRVILEKFIRIHEKDSAVTKKRLMEQQEKLYRITCRNLEIIRKSVYR